MSPSVSRAGHRAGITSAGQDLPQTSPPKPRSRPLVAADPAVEHLQSSAVMKQPIMIAVDVRGAGGVHPKSEISDKPISDGRQLTIEWTTSL